MPSAADARARSRSWPTAHLSLDAMRHALKSGYANPADGWNDESQWQYELARSNCALLARRYLEHGVTCVIDDAIFPAWQAVGYEGWARDLGDLPHALVVLLPSWEAVLERHRERGVASRLPEPMLRTIYDDMLPWRDRDVPVIDTTALTVPDTIQALDAALDLLA